MSNEIKLGIIGAGHWGPNHVRVFSTTPSVKISMVSDLNVERLNNIGKLYPDIKLVKDYQEILNDKDINAVIIATPTLTHYEITKNALLAGKHVLVEKPLCQSSSQGQELVKLAKEANLVLMVGQVFLFNNGILKLKEYLEFNDLGRIYYIGSTRTNLGPIRQDVNAVYDLASHDIAIFNFLLGSKPFEVSSVGESFLQKDIEDLAFISMRYPNNVLARVHVSWLDPRKVREITIVGDKKMVLWDDLATIGPIQVFDKGVVREPYYDDYGHFHLLAREGDIIIPKVKLEEPLKNQAKYFLNAIKKGRVDVSDGNSGLDVVKVLEAIQQSLKEHGKAIEVN
ncbi:MAG: Gfo/Idh/MocA family oxidoreductase [Acidobacteria bacterium]|nr:Gfo/Idh/MocA family oxidoreductase [Acidobacteriota bacterium]